MNAACLRPIVVCSLILTLTVAAGCSMSIGGSPYNLDEDVVYHPRGPEFKLWREAEALKQARESEQPEPATEFKHPPLEKRTFELEATLDESELTVKVHNRSNESIGFYHEELPWRDKQFYLIYRNAETGDVLVSEYLPTFEGGIVSGRGPGYSEMKAGDSRKFILDTGEQQWSHRKKIKREGYELDSVLFSPHLSASTILNNNFHHRLICRVKKTFELESTAPSDSERDEHQLPPGVLLQIGDQD